MITTNNPFLRITGDRADVIFNPSNTVSHSSSPELVLKGDATVCHSKYKKITSDANLWLQGCTVGEVLAKNLFITNSTYEKAAATESAWVQPKVGPDGELRVGGVHTGKEQIFIFPLSVKKLHYFKTASGGNIYCHKEIETLILEDATVPGDVLFEPNKNIPPSARTVTLLGNTVLRGQVKGATLIDLRVKSEQKDAKSL